MRNHRAGVFNPMLDSIQANGWGSHNKTGIETWEGGGHDGDGGVFDLPSHRRKAIRSVNHIKLTATRGGEITAKIYYALAVV